MIRNFHLDREHFLATHLVCPEGRCGFSQTRKENRRRGISFVLLLLDFDRHGGSLVRLRELTQVDQTVLQPSITRQHESRGPCDQRCSPALKLMKVILSPSHRRSLSYKSPAGTVIRVRLFDAGGKAGQALGLSQSSKLCCGRNSQPVRFLGSFDPRGTGVRCGQFLLRVCANCAFWPRPASLGLLLARRV